MGRFLGRDVEVGRFWKPSGDVTPFYPPGQFSENSSAFGDFRVEQAVPVVQACLNRIASQIGMLPLMVVDEETGQEITGRRKPVWVKDPNIYQTSTALVQMIVCSLLLHGNAYVVPLRSRDGRVVQVAVAHPTYVEPTSTGRGPRHYYYNGELFDGEMIHIMYLSLAQRLRGVGPFPGILPLVRVSEAGMNYTQALIDNAGAHQLLFVYPKGTTQDEQRAALVQYRAKKTGLRNAWAPLMLSGDVRVEQISQSNADTAFMELARLTEARIISYGFNLDPQDFGISGQEAGESLTYKNEQGRWWRMWQMALAPLVHLIQEELSNLLPAGQKLVLSNKNFVAGGPQAITDKVAAIAQMNASQVSIGDSPVVYSDEMREMLGWPERLNPPSLEKPKPEIKEVMVQADDVKGGGEMMSDDNGDEQSE